MEPVAAYQVKVTAVQETDTEPVVVVAEQVLHHRA
jgi:hypothetical protein